MFPIVTYNPYEMNSCTSTCTYSIRNAEDALKTLTMHSFYVDLTLTQFRNVMKARNCIILILGRPGPPGEPGKKSTIFT